LSQESTQSSFNDSKIDLKESTIDNKFSFQPSESNGVSLPLYFGNKNDLAQTQYFNENLVSFEDNILMNYNTDYYQNEICSLTNDYFKFNDQFYFDH